MISVDSKIFNVSKTVTGMDFRKNELTIQIYVGLQFCLKLVLKKKISVNRARCFYRNVSDD